MNLWQLVALAQMCFQHLMMTACDSQITGSLTIGVLDEKVGTMTNQKLHTPEHVKVVGRRFD